jgi:hypothetical protein
VRLLKNLNKNLKIINFVQQIEEYQDRVAQEEQEELMQNE